MDTVTTGGTGIILGSVRKIATAYDGQGNAYLFTSLNASDGIVNQVKRDYNGLGQLVTEWQATSGYVYGSTPKVQYTYSEMAGGANHSRLTGMVYPSGYALSYNYGSGLDSDISRLSSLSDSSGVLESYAYLGLSTVVCTENAILAAESNAICHHDSLGVSDCDNKQAIVIAFVTSESCRGRCLRENMIWHVPSAPRFRVNRQYVEVNRKPTQRGLDDTGDASHRPLRSR